VSKTSPSSVNATSEFLAATTEYLTKGFGALKEKATDFAANAMTASNNEV
jgi:hypothetical protein